MKKILKTFLFCLEILCMISEKIYSPFLWPRASCGSSSVISSRRKERLSVMTNVSASGPRTTSPHGAQKVAVQSVSTQLCQSWLETLLAQVTSCCMLYSCGKARGPKLSMVLSKHTNSGHCPDLSTILVKSGTLRNADSLVGPRLTLHFDEAASDACACEGAGQC